MVYTSYLPKLAWCDTILICDFDALNVQALALLPVSKRQEVKYLYPHFGNPPK